jgi:hypothetical protein
LPDEVAELPPASKYIRYVAPANFGSPSLGTGASISKLDFRNNPSTTDSFTRRKLAWADDSTCLFLSIETSGFSVPPARTGKTPTMASLAASSLYDISISPSLCSTTWKRFVVLNHVKSWIFP